MSADAIKSTGLNINPPLSSLVRRNESYLTFIYSIDVDEVENPDNIN
ncbi:hypothetical protein JL09_g5634 [Pichia kudriavzevii]|uniref:Uncharacterized protein n=1 Tax=Pichia kudriavzevii TaxID=4909 RepID=A0A099NTK4_PICKU|nr:hypothetical protein JL09_g5634 [Pichia kudriavzevii]